MDGGELPDQDAAAGSLSDIGSSPEKRILLTGASGYIASHCLYQLLEKGCYVRGTVRSLNETAKVAPLRSLHASCATHLELIEADLQHDAGWGKAFEGVAAVLHVASPFPTRQPASADEIIIPAVEGTRRVMEFAVGYGVSRVVLTSSVYAVTGGHPKKRYLTSQGNPFTEDDWSVPEKQSWWYARSKTLAEHTAWKIANKSSKTDLITLAAGFVLGPMLLPTVSRSSDIVRQILMREISALPPVQYPCVDVRDCAKGHVIALLNLPAKEARADIPRRFLLAAESLTLGQIAAILKQSFSTYAFRVQTRVIPRWAAKMGSCCNHELQNIGDEIGLPQYVSNERSVKHLGLAYRPISDAVVDHALSLVRFGIVPSRNLPTALTTQFPYPRSHSANLIHDD